MNEIPNPIIPNFNPNNTFALGSIHKIDHDGFEGEVIGYYKTREGKEGVVLEQLGTRVVHVYGTKWLK